jgi:hypothetical protein
MELGDDTLPLGKRLLVETMVAVFAVPFTFLTFLLTFLLTLPMALYQAWVLTWLWEWFAVPVLRVPSLDLGYAFGLSLIVFLFTAPSAALQASSAQKPAFRNILFLGFLGPTSSLAAGWIVKTVLCAS